MDFETLKGRTLVMVTVSEDNDFINFVTDDGAKFILHHEQDCCENVWIEDVTGDTDDLVGTPILVAEERDNGDVEPLPDSDESFTWTFYELRTIRGSVTIRWFGSSNGYYSEEVDFAEVGPHDPRDSDAWVVAGDLAISKGQSNPDGSPNKADQYRAYFRMGGN